MQASFGFRLAPRALCTAAALVAAFAGASFARSQSTDTSRSRPPETSRSRAAEASRFRSAEAPRARVIPKVDTLHGEVRVDDYFWLRDKKDPEVIAYLQAENHYADSMMLHNVALRDTLYREMVSRIRETDRSVPDRIDNWYYYTRTEKGKQYSIFARKRGTLSSREQVLLDQNAMAAGRSYFRVGAMRASPDHKRLAFTVDTSGAEYFTLMVKDLETGALLPDRVHDVHFDVEWANDNQTLLYTKTDAAQRPDRVLQHTLGEPASRDVEIYREPDELFRVSVDRTKDGAYLVVQAESFTSSEARYLRADRPGDTLRLLRAREPNVEYVIEHHRDRFLIVTNEGAPNFKLVQAPDSNPASENWHDVVAGRPTTLLDGIDVFRHHIVLYERRDGLRRVRVMDARSDSAHEISFPESVYTARGGENPEFDTRSLRIFYTSLVTPLSVYDYDMATRQRTLRKRTEVLGGYDPARYATERTFARASDGTMIPISLVYKKPLVRDGSRPMLLYAYGSYGSSTDPTFSSNNVSLVDRGVVYAIAHVRGGQEMGRAWYDQGKMLNKRNTFTDFISGAEHLVRERYTSPARLAARGGSAGGLLMGAVVNLRPDLFRAVVADVPFVDVINTMLDASIPLTAGEWEQWGDPRRKEHYDYMRSYSPYDNVERKAYPSMLVTTGLNDPRVAYWEPAKWVAKLRAYKTDDHALLLRTNMGAGHGGSSGRYDALREQAFRFAFILDALGLSGQDKVSSR